MEKPAASPSALLLTLVLLLLAPPLLQARELGGSYEQHVRAPLVLPASGGGGDGAVVLVPPEFNKLPGVGRSGGRVPPAPKPGHGPHPLHEPSPPSHGLSIVSSPGVSGREGHAPPSTWGNTPPDYRRSGSAAGVLDGVFLVLRDTLVRYGVGA